MEIYVGTYAKYNVGDLSGHWLNVTDYSNHEEFIEACLKAHSDEGDPELMFQDVGELPADLADESYIDPLLWEVLGNKDVDAAIAFIENGGINDFESFDDAYLGQWDSEEEFCRSLLHESGELDCMVGYEKYFNYEKYANDLFIQEFYMLKGGYVFANM